MSSFRRSGLCLSSLFVVLLTAGCVRTRVTVFDPGAGANRRTPAELIRFYELQRPTCAYREVGHISAHSAFFSSWDRVVRTARERAYRMGGDAIVSVHEQSRITGAVLSRTQISATETTTLSGTVIRFTNPACRE